MKWWANLLKRMRTETGTGANITRWLSDWMGSTPSAAGVAVTEQNSLTIPAVFTAVRIIGSTMGALPLHVYRRTDKGREYALMHWAYALLHESPNDYHTSYSWRELMISHILLWGNHYSRIEWLKNGAASDILPLMPWDVEPYRNDSGAQLYHIQEPGGGERIPAEEIIHVPGLGFDGVKGLSVARTMRDSMGLSKAMENFSGAFFANGAKPGAILETPGRMNETAQKNLAKSIMEQFGSASDAFKVLVLEEGSKLHTYTMPLQDAQLLEARKLSRSEIFGLYGVPPHLGGDTERSTSWGTGIEQQDIGYAKHTITPLCVRIEQELNRKLFGRGSGLYSKFNLEGLQRGDFKSRMEGYRVAVGGPFLSRAEAREIEDWNLSDEPGMDKVLTPLNMGVGATPPVPEPLPAPAPQSEDDDRGVHVHLPERMEIKQEDEDMRAVHIHLPEKLEHQINHVHDLPDVRAVAEASVKSAQHIADAVGESLAQQRQGIDRIAEAVAKPRRAVYDKDGNPLGTVAVDQLET